MMLPLTETQEALLQHLCSCGKTEQRLALRANILRSLAQGLPVVTTAKRLNITPKTVRKWRDRWREAADRFSEVENEPESLILKLLSDAPRSGAPPEFTPEQITQIVALSCEHPSESGRPITQWTQRELADEAEKRGIVEQISHRSVGRFLKRGRSQAPSVAVLAHQ